MSDKKDFEFIELTFIINKVMEVFLQFREEIKTGEFLENLRIDIKLAKEEDEYSIQISNCGNWKMEHYENVLQIMNQVRGKAILKSENIFFYTNIDPTEESKLQVCSEIQLIPADFSYYAEFFSIKLERKLNSSNLQEFEKLVLKKMYELKDVYSKVKFTFSRDSEVLLNDDTEFNKDLKTCSLISLALTNIVKQSQREEFRRKCFDLYKVNNFEELDYSIRRKLLSYSCINEKKVTTRKKSDSEE